MLHRGLVSLTEANAIQESNTAGFHHGDVTDPDWSKQVGLSQDEAQITDFEIAVQFRYQGWPPACAQCHLQLDYDSDYWMDCSRQEGEICLVHVDCLQDWSHRGLPAACVHCQLPLDYKKDGWRCVEGDDGVFGLMHMTCWLSDGPMQRTWQVAHGALTRAGVDAEKIRAIIGSSPLRS